MSKEKEGSQIQGQFLGKHPAAWKPHLPVSQRRKKLKPFASLPALVSEVSSPPWMRNAGSETSASVCASSPNHQFGKRPTDLSALFGAFLSQLCKVQTSLLDHWD